MFEKYGAAKSCETCAKGPKPCDEAKISRIAQPGGNLLDACWEPKETQGDEE